MTNDTLIIRLNNVPVLIGYNLIFTLWAISSVPFHSAEPSCRQLEDQPEFSLSCDHIDLNEYQNTPIFDGNTKEIDVILFGTVRGKFDASILSNFTRLRSILLFNCSLELFEISSKSLENLQFVDSSFPIDTKFTNCCENLEKLTFRNNTGLELQSGALTDLRKLRKLYLTDQYLPRITQSTFKGLRSLKKLSLTNTSTASIDADAFVELTKLKEFHLEDNTMETIDSNVFKPLKRLTSLTIYGDNLKPLSLEMFSRQKGLVQLGLPLSTWRVINVEEIPIMFPKLYAHSYVGKWKNQEEKEYFQRTFSRLSQLLVDRQ